MSNIVWRNLDSPQLDFFSVIFFFRSLSRRNMCNVRMRSSLPDFHSSSCLSLKVSQYLWSVRKWHFHLISLIQALFLRNLIRRFCPIDSNFEFTNLLIFCFCFKFNLLSRAVTRKIYTHFGLKVSLLRRVSQNFSEFHSAFIFRNWICVSKHFIHTYCKNWN